MSSCEQRTTRVTEYTVIILSLLLKNSHQCVIIEVLSTLPFRIAGETLVKIVMEASTMKVCVNLGRLRTNVNRQIPRFRMWL
jgi:hypothetical protein